MTWTCGGRHVLLYWILSQPWCPFANIKFIDECMFGISHYKVWKCLYLDFSMKQHHTTHLILQCGLSHQWTAYDQFTGEFSPQSNYWTIFGWCVWLLSYLELLSHWLIPKPDNVRLLNSVILQHGALAHCTADMGAFLDSQFHCGLDDIDLSSGLSEAQTWPLATADCSLLWKKRIV